ncbi:MAG TPA: TIGR00730 family Rossman fold protein [Myxococcota bacterium]|nr:TIGR00730 family Rossman fold protein [Myxococcota bacterium]
MRRVCVFCGSSAGGRPSYRDAAAQLGRTLAERRIALVYGGASVGLMGVLADAVLHAGGSVVGVIPQALAKEEVVHDGLTALRIVGSMHERKAVMADLSDGFIALPGGMGTLDELFEMVTWAQLGLHRKPCGLLDVEGYFAPLLAFLDHAVKERFVKETHRALLLVAAEPGALLDAFAAQRASAVAEWTDRNGR